MTYPPPLYHGDDGEVSASYRPDGTEPELVYRNGTRHTDPTPAVPLIHIARLPPDVEHLVGRDSQLATLDAIAGSALAPAAVDQARACWREAVEICRSLDHPLAMEASHWLDREVPTDPDEWFAVDGPRRFRINQLP